MAADTEKASQWPGEIAHGAEVDLSDLKWLTLLPLPQIGPRNSPGPLPQLPTVLSTSLLPLNN